MNHPTREELFEYVDRSGETADSRAIAEHLKECMRCRREHEASIRLGEALRIIPVETTSPAFTRNVMKRLGIPEPVPLWWIFMKNFAPILAAAVIVFTLLTLGSVSGIGPDANVQKSLLDFGKMETAVRGAWGSLSAGTADFLKSHLSFAFAKESPWLTVYLIVFFIGIALADRYIFGPMLRRRR